MGTGKGGLQPDWRDISTGRMEARVQDKQNIGRMELVNSDFSNQEGTCCYCSEEAARQIRQTVASMPLHAVHFLGTGDCHYVSLFWIELVREPFALVLFDNHPDDQPCAFGSGILSCGSWVADARDLSLCKAVSWFNGKGEWKGDAVPDGLPVYLSIDLDVLSKDCIETDWDQGEIRMEALEAAVSEVVSGHSVLGADICGGPPAGSGDFTRSLELAHTLISLL